jgi:6-phosphofructo-2-kinase / fructose-2,6-biphosphatase 4
MVAPLYTTASGLLFHAGKILVCTVGLPARGKTHISRALERYLRWTGVKVQVISLGDYRRKVLGSAQKLPPDYFTLGLFIISCVVQPDLRNCSRREVCRDHGPTS